MHKFFVFLILSFLVSGCVSNKTNLSEEKKSATDELANRVIKCKYCIGYEGPGGACYSGAGGAISKTPGGDCYAGPGGNLYAGAGGPLSTTPGGACSEAPGGNCFKGPGSDGKNCSLACRLNKK